ncbi:MAG: LuxR C-terminal-related transcriptional regulator [Candidatus Bathyarchaeia archaeon]
MTEREQKILRLNAEGLSDYQIAKKLKIETPNVYRARKTALRKLENGLGLICPLLTALSENNNSPYLGKGHCFNLAVFRCLLRSKRDMIITTKPATASIGIVN